MKTWLPFPGPESIGYRSGRAKSPRNRDVITNRNEPRLSSLRWLLSQKMEAGSSIYCVNHMKNSQISFVF